MWSIQLKIWITVQQWWWGAAQIQLCGQSHHGCWPTYFVSIQDSWTNIEVHIPPIYITRGVFIDRDSWYLKARVKVQLLGDLKLFERRNGDREGVGRRVIKEKAEHNRQSLPTPSPGGNQTIPPLKVWVNNWELHFLRNHSRHSNSPANHGRDSRQSYLHLRDFWSIEVANDPEESQWLPNPRYLLENNCKSSEASRKASAHIQNLENDQCSPWYMRGNYMSVSSQWLLYQNTPSYLRSFTIYGTSVMCEGSTFDHSTQHKPAIPGFPVLISRVSSYKDWSWI